MKYALVHQISITIKAVLIKETTQRVVWVTRATVLMVKIYIAWMVYANAIIKTIGVDLVVFQKAVMENFVKIITNAW